MPFEIFKILFGKRTGKVLGIGLHSICFTNARIEEKQANTVLGTCTWTMNLDFSIQLPKQSDLSYSFSSTSTYICIFEIVLRKGKMMEKKNVYIKYCVLILWRWRNTLSSKTFYSSQKKGILSFELLLLYYRKAFIIDGSRIDDKNGHSFNFSLVYAFSPR